MADYQSLIGREWIYGKFDCWSIIMDYYSKKGIKLPDHERPKDLITLDKSMYLERMPQMGFIKIDFDSRKSDDILVMKLGTKTPMHGAIYLLGDRILHQKYESISCIENYNAYYRRNTKAVFRYGK
tara:strand:- start:464 stop:841 length:378 start_codon:yes stop_codon:yes gene_type:complete